MVELIQYILGINKKNKILIFEYMIGIILAFSLWGYHIINTASISQEIAKESNL